jgi:carboxyl-terminal processing protease
MRSRAVIVASTLAGSLITGGWLMQRGFVSGGGTRSVAQATNLFDEVVTHVRRYYVDSLDQDALYGKAIDGVLQELHDPHSVYLDPKRLARLNESTTGRYAGIGVQMDVRDGWITVIAPLPGTPAERGGIETGDRIVEIDGRATEKWTSEEAQKALRGPAGTTVRLAVERAGVDARIPFTVKREAITLQAVQHSVMLQDGIGYVDLTSFSAEAASDLRRAIDSLRRAGVTGLILDLRNNPGGLLEAGVDVSDLFLDPDQIIVSMRGRSPDANRVYKDRAPQPFAGLPMVVLVDSTSASASEIVAGALQDHDRAAIVGTASYGKGSAQSLFRMSDGGALKLTTALWYTPSGRSINRARAVREEGGDEEPSQFTIDTTEAPAPFRTDMGRRITGGGGIHPDVLVPNRILSETELALERALGENLTTFRDVLTAYAIEVKGRRSVTSPDFPVTAAMRAELFQRMQTRGIEIDRATYDDAAPLVDRLIGDMIAQYVFGRRGEALRAAREDSTVIKALELLRGAKTPKDVIERAGRSR